MAIVIKFSTHEFQRTSPQTKCISNCNQGNYVSKKLNNLAVHLRVSDQGLNSVMQHQYILGPLFCVLVTTPPHQLPGQMTLKHTLMSILEGLMTKSVEEWLTPFKRTAMVEGNCRVTFGWKVPYTETTSSVWPTVTTMLSTHIREES
jgi:hypothetical protein